MANYELTRKGYRRNTTTGTFEHVEVWQLAHGEPVPAGYQVHHIDRDKTNNHPDNLVALTPTDHKRIHSGCELRNGEWWKPCGICHEFKRIGADDWYLSPEGWPLYGRCRPCHIARVVIDKRLRRMRRAAAA
jgi:hypothetical protein